MQLGLVIESFTGAEVSVRADLIITRLSAILGPWRPARGIGGHRARGAVRAGPTLDRSRDLEVEWALRDGSRLTVATPVVQRHEHATTAPRGVRAASALALSDERTTAKIVNLRPRAHHPPRADVEHVLVTVPRYDGVAPACASASAWSLGTSAVFVSLARALAFMASGHKQGTPLVPRWRQSAAGGDT